MYVTANKCWITLHVYQSRNINIPIAMFIIAISMFILSDICCDVHRLKEINANTPEATVSRTWIWEFNVDGSSLQPGDDEVAVHNYYKIHRYCHSIYFACFRLIVINYSEFRSAHAEIINSSLSLRWISISWVSEIAFHSQCQHYNISSKPLHDCRLQAITLAIMPTKRDYPEVAWYLM